MEVTGSVDTRPPSRFVLKKTCGLAVCTSTVHYMMSPTKEMRYFAPVWYEPLDTFGDLQLCSKCRSILTKKIPVPPKDAIANFRHHGTLELPDEVRDAILAASPFKVMLEALCRATVITHHYQFKYFLGRLPDEASQCFDRGNVDILHRMILLPDIDEIDGSVCIIYPGLTIFHTYDRCFAT